MDIFTPMKPANQLPSAAERRRKGRIRTHNLKCELGKVVDISASGLRILRKRKCTIRPGQTMMLNLRSDIDRFDVNTKVVRVIQLKNKRWEIAVELIAPDKEIREKLMVHARSAGMKGFAHLD